MRHFAENRESNGSRLSKFSVGIICAIAVALATPAAYAQRGGSGRSGGAGRFGRGGSNRSRPFGGAPPTRACIPFASKFHPPSLRANPSHPGLADHGFDCNSGTGFISDTASGRFMDGFHPGSRIVFPTRDGTVTKMNTARQGPMSPRRQHLSKFD